MPEERVLPKRLQDKVDKVRDIEEAMLQLADDLKYPVDVQGNVVDLNHLPDIPPTLVYHLVRAGWRRDDAKRLIKPRPVEAPGYYEDLVAWVPADSEDGPIQIREPAPVSDLWSVKPVINETFEERQ